MIPGILAVWLSVAPGGAAACPAAPPLTLGPDAAPVTVIAHVDPVRSGARTTYVELRRLVAEYRGELRVELRLRRASRVADRTGDHVRLLVMAAADAGKLPAALALVDRDGKDRVLARLQEPMQRAALASALGLDADRVATLEQDACLRRRLASASESVERRAATSSPGFELDGRLISGHATLNTLRVDLARRASREARDRRRPLALTRPTTKGVSSELVRPRMGRGVLLGGPGLPHHAVLLARDESDPNLALSLPPLLDYRSQHPGRLSLQVLAVGGTQLTDDLRIRMCAARRLGRELDYLRFLARDRSGDRMVLGPDESMLLEALDAEAETCDEPPPDLDPTLSAGPWIDGTPRSRGELDALPVTLQLLESARVPLSPLLGGRPPGGR